MNCIIIHTGFIWGTVTELFVTAPWFIHYLGGGLRRLPDYGMKPRLRRASISGLGPQCMLGKPPLLVCGNNNETTNHNVEVVIANTLAQLMNTYSRKSTASTKQDGS